MKSKIPSILLYFYLWDWKRTQILPYISCFKLKVKNKFEIENYVCMKNNTLDKFHKKWLINKWLVKLIAILEVVISVLIFYSTVYYNTVKLVTVTVSSTSRM